MDLSVQDDQGFTIIQTAGKLNVASLAEFEKQLNEAVAGDDSKVILEFSGVEYIGSASLRVILILAKKLQGGNGYLALCNLSDMARQVMKMSGFDLLVPIYDDVESAKAGADA